MTVTPALALSSRSPHAASPAAAPAAPAPAPMRIGVDAATAGSPLTVVVTGEVDSVTAAGLLGALTEVLARPGVVQVVVDLAGVTFLDSAGLCALAGAHRAAVRASQVLLIDAGSNRVVIRPLQMTGLWDVLAHTAG